MHKSRTITIAVQRPWRVVFDFLIEPRNLPSWATLPDPNLVPLNDMDWVSSRNGRRTVIRFPQRNEFGILDHAIFAEGSVPMTTPMRVVANDDGAEIQYTLYQREGMSEQQFASEIEWLTSDLNALKTMLESADRSAGRQRAGR